MIRNILCSRSMLYGCNSSSPLRHCCMVPSDTCHWHRYIFLIACAPHFFFLVVILSFIMVWIIWLGIELSRGKGVLTVVSPCGGVHWVGLMRFVDGGGGGYC